MNITFFSKIILRTPSHSLQDLFLNVNNETNVDRILQDSFFLEGVKIASNNFYECLLSNSFKKGDEGF